MTDDQESLEGTLMGFLGDIFCAKCRKKKDVMEFPRATSVIITNNAITYHNPDGKNVNVCNQCHSEIASTPSGN